MPPVPIETCDRATIYNTSRDEWSEGLIAIFRPPAKYAAINISAVGNSVIVAGETRKKIRIVAIFFTVAGEVNVTLYDGETAISGPMDFGGTSEPRGIVAPFPFSPLEISEGADLKINLSAAVQVSGTVCYYHQ